MTCLEAVLQGLRERIREVNNAAALVPAERILALINSQPRTPTREEIAKIIGSGWVW
jgi:hypothetical protein